MSRPAAAPRGAKGEAATIGDLLAMAAAAIRVVAPGLLIAVASAIISMLMISAWI